MFRPEKKSSQKEASLLMFRHIGWGLESIPTNTNMVGDDSSDATTSLESDIHVFELPAVGEADTQCDMQRRPKI